MPDAVEEVGERRIHTIFKKSGREGDSHANSTATTPRSAAAEKEGSSFKQKTKQYTHSGWSPPSLTGTPAAVITSSASNNSNGNSSNYIQLHQQTAPSATTSRAKSRGGAHISFILESAFKDINSSDKSYMSELHSLDFFIFLPIC